MRRTRRNPAVTDTAAFRRWFGDSKVVDEHGEPLVVYHGTNKSFDVFKTRSRSVNSTTFGPAETERSGIFVSDNPDFAREFGSRLLSLYARIENLAEISAAGSGSRKDPVPAFSETIDAFDERDLWLLAKHVSRPWQLFDGQLGPRFIAYLQDLGYDGATFIEDVPKGDDVGDDEQEYVEGRTYVVFDAAQVKSATDNDGSFDVDDPDLRSNPDESHVRIVYGARRMAQGGFAPVVTQHGPGDASQMHGGWVARPYDEDAAVEIAREHAEELASRYVGDWTIEVVPEGRANPRRRR